MSNAPVVMMLPQNKAQGPVAVKRPIVVLGHLHGDMYPCILNKMPQTADNGGQTRWDYYAAIEFAKMGYDVRLVNYGKFKGPGIRESFMTPDGRILTPYEATHYDGPKVTFLHVAPEGYGQEFDSPEFETKFHVLKLSDGMVVRSDEEKTSFINAVNRIADSNVLESITKDNLSNVRSALTKVIQEKYGNQDNPTEFFLNTLQNEMGDKYPFQAESVREILEKPGQDLYLKYFQPLGELQQEFNEIKKRGNLTEEDIRLAELAIEIQRDLATQKYLDANAQEICGIAKEKLWPYIPSISIQCAEYLEPHREKIAQGESFIYGGYADYGYFSILLREKMNFPEMAFPSVYVTHSVSIGSSEYAGKEHTVLEPILNPEISKRTVANGNILIVPAFIDKSVKECSFPVRRLIEESMVRLQPIVLATSPSHFGSYPFLQDTRRKGLAVPGIDHDKSKILARHLAEDPLLRQYADMSPIEAARAYLAAQELPTDKTILYAGARLQSIKGFQHVISTAAELGKVRKDICVLVTAGPQAGKRDAAEQAYWESLSKQARDQGVNLILRPGTNDIYRYMAAIGENGGFFLNLAEFEPFGMAPMEGNANGVPIIVHHQAGCVASGYMTDGINVVVGDYQSPEMTAARILEVIENPELYQSLRAGGLALAATTTWENTVKSSVRQLRELQDRMRSGELQPLRETHREHWDRILGLAGFINREAIQAIQDWKPDAMPSHQGAYAAEAIASEIFYAYASQGRG